MTMGSFREIPDNYNYILSQYDIVASYNGEIVKPTEAQLEDLFRDKSSLILVANEKQITDLNMGQYGYLTQEEFLDYAYKALKENDMDDGGNYDEELIEDYLDGIAHDYFVGDKAKTFTFYPNDTAYSKADPGETFKIGNFSYPAEYKYNPECSDFSEEGAVDLRVKVILQKKKNIIYGCLSSGMYYTNALTNYMLETSKDSAIVKHINSTENEQLFFLPYNYAISHSVDGVYVKAFLPLVFFDNKNIEKVTVQENIHTLSNGSFLGCTNLKSIVLKHSEPADISVGYELLDGTANCTIFVPEASLGKFENNYFWGRYARQLRGY